MRRLSALTGVLLIALVGAGSAQATHLGGIVIDSNGDATAAAMDVYTQGGRVLATNMSGWYLTTTTTILGESVPAGSHLTVAQATAVTNMDGGLAAVAAKAPAGSYAPPVDNPIESTKQRNVDSEISKAKRAGRLYPALKSVGKIGLVVGLGGLPVYEAAVKMQIPGQGTIYELITGAEYGSMPAQTWRWERIGSNCGLDGASACDVSSISNTGLATVTTGWYLWNSAFGAFYDTDLHPHGVAEAGTQVCGINGDATWCQKTRTDAEMEALTGTRPINGDTYNDYSTTKYDLGTYTRPTETAGDRTAVGTSLGGTGTQTGPQKDAEEATANKIAPGTVPTGGTATGTADDPIYVSPTPTTVPGAPALDFSPISDIDFGCKFPYGIFCYALAFTDLFDVTPDAPCFCFDLDGFDTPAGTMSLGSYNVDLEVMDGWMETWRSILSVVLWVGAVYFVATRLLGFKAGGDPGEAMDDVL